MARATLIDYDARELGQLVQSMARAGAAVDAIQSRMLDIAEKGVAVPARARAPKRSGRLRRSIRTELKAGASKASGARVDVGEARVVQDTDIALYGPIVHFGWSTRGLQKRAAATKGVNAKGKITAKASREAFRTELVGAGFSKRAADKAFRTAQARKLKGSDKMVDRVRGGPIKPNPWFYDVAGDRARAVFERLDREADAIVKAFEAGS
jgi:hypothetical protein